MLLYKESVYTTSDEGWGILFFLSCLPFFFCFSVVPCLLCIHHHTIYTHSVVRPCITKTYRLYCNSPAIYIYIFICVCAYKCIRDVCFPPLKSNKVRFRLNTRTGPLIRRRRRQWPFNKTSVQKAAMTMSLFISLFTFFFYIYLYIRPFHSS